MRDNQLSHERDPTRKKVKPSLAFDLDQYREHLTDFNLTAEQQDEYLFMLWSIVVQFVELGFPVECNAATTSQKLSTDELKAAFSKDDSTAHPMVPLKLTELDQSFEGGKLP